MKLFSKEINLKLFKQYPKGGDLKNQVVVTKIFNPYNAGRWYLINSDPDDPDYIWAIVQMGSTVEVGSVSRKELENIRIKPFNLPLERDLYFDPVNAAELFKGLSEGKFYKAGGWTEGSENKAMLLNQAEGFEHHAEELEKAVKASDHIPAWVVAKSERASTDLSDITHYLDGENEQKREMVEGEEEEEYADGGIVKWEEAEYGDNALVVSENKMGVIIKPYGRKFHLKFVDGTEKTYDASELKFFKDMDDFDRGGKMAYGGIMNVGRYYKDKKGETFRFVGNETFINKNGEYVRKSITEFYEGGGETTNKNYSTWAFWKEEYENYIKELKEKIKADYDDDEVSFLTKQQEYELETYEDKLEKHLEQGKEKGWYGKGGYMAEGGDVKKQEWVAVYVNQEKPSERKIIQAFGDSKEEATRNARMSEGYHGIKKPFELTEIYTYSGNLPMMAEGGDVKNRYKITVYHGGEGKDEVVYADSISEAREKAGKGEHAEIYDTVEKEEIMAEGGVMNDEKYKKRMKMFGYKPYGKTKGSYKIDYKIDGEKQSEVRTSLEEAEDAKKRYEKIGYTDVKITNVTDKMAEGGKVKFKDKVKSVKESLLKRKKVAKKVQKDYGKTYSPKEAEDSAKRIVGAMTAKERLQARLKKRKK